MWSGVPQRIHCNNCCSTSNNFSFKEQGCCSVSKSCQILCNPLNCKAQGGSHFPGMSPAKVDGHEFEYTPRVGDGQGGLECCDSRGRKESDMTERLNWTKLSWKLSCLDLTVRIITNCGKLLKGCKYQATLPISWENCTPAKKQLLEPCMEQLTGPGLRKDYDKHACCHPVYLP